MYTEIKKKKEILWIKLKQKQAMKNDDSRKGK